MAPFAAWKVGSGAGGCVTAVFWERVDTDNNVRATPHVVVPAAGAADVCAVKSGQTGDPSTESYFVGLPNGVQFKYRYCRVWVARWRSTLTLRSAACLVTRPAIRLRHILNDEGFI